MNAPNQTQPRENLLRITLLAAVDDPQLKARFAATGTELGFEDAAAVRRQFDEDLPRWTAIIRERGITAEG
jgi:hypothetical protein